MRSIIRSGGQLVFGILTLSVAAVAAENSGAGIYKERCAQCHDATAGARIPARAVLQELTPEAIEHALTDGVMKQQGAFLSKEDRVQVAGWLSKVVAKPQPEVVGTHSCVIHPDKLMPAGSEWTSWGQNAENWRYQPKPGLADSDVSRLKLKWAFGFPGTKMMRSQPASYRGRVYLGTDNGSVVALDAKSGCLIWNASVGNVRSALVIGQSGWTDALFFGDGLGVVHALDLTSGKQLWRTKVADHAAALITGAPAYVSGRLYVPVSSYEEVLAKIPTYTCCSFRGSIVALDTVSGKVIWQTHTIAEPSVQTSVSQKGHALWGPSGASIWSSPTVDLATGALYVTTGDNYSEPSTATSDALLSLDMKSGKLLWSKQFTPADVYNLSCGDPAIGNCKNGSGSDFDFGASPILVTLSSGKRCVLLGQKSGMVYAVDPDRQGEILWQARAGRGGTLGGIQWGPATDGRLVFVPISDIAFQKSDNPKQLNPNPRVGGGLLAYRIDSGAVAWKALPPSACAGRSNCSPAQSAAVTAIPGAVFSGSLDGHIRAYSSSDGSVIWDFDTVRSFPTVNGVTATGGSFDVGGPVVAEGMIFVTPGYAQYGGNPGNVLLAFGIE